MTPEQIKDFVKSKYNSIPLEVAKRQQSQLSYFTQSCVQEEVTQEYLNAWANRDFKGPDYFTNWIKMIFRPDNYMSFVKYLRHPVPSSQIVNDKIKTQLKRVFTSEDSYFRYVVKGKEVPAPDFLQIKDFTEDFFEHMLFRHNDIIFHDLSAVNTPTRYFVRIENVVCIDSENSRIEKIAFAAQGLNSSGVMVKGYIYADAEMYAFLDIEYNIIRQSIHDLGECPAMYIPSEYFPLKFQTLYHQSDVVRVGIFSYIREMLEEYVFLKTLLKMADANGALPIVVQLDGTEMSPSGNDIQGVSDKEPMSFNEVGGQQARLGSEVTPSKSDLQAGTILKIKPSFDSEGILNTDLVNNYMTFYRIPADSLTYMNTRVSEVEDCIVSSILGDYDESTGPAINELQVSKSYVSKEDKIRDISNTLSKGITKSDNISLSLAFGKGNAEASDFFGSDFFSETQGDLYDQVAKSPNPIETRTLLKKLSRNRNMHNATKAKREEILYNLLPYALNSDYTSALSQFIVPRDVMALQSRFNYWIDFFEAQYGDILSYWESLPSPDSAKIILINNLLNTLINESEALSPPPPLEGFQNGI